MAVESMTVHPNSPTTNHEHNSLLTDERSSNSTIIFKWNYLFVLCFDTKSRGFLFLFFLSEGLNSPFLENEYRGKERHVYTTTPTGRPNSTWDNLIPRFLLLLRYHNRLESTCLRNKKTRSKQLINYTFTAILANSTVIKQRLITFPSLTAVNSLINVDSIVWECVSVCGEN